MGMTPPTNWWERPDLCFKDGALHLAGEHLETLARTMGTPVFAYSAPRVRENLARLHRALRARSLRARIFYAIKANRFAPLLTVLRATGMCGIDACSPDEVALARQIGFAESQISFTGTSVSDDDLDVLLRFSDLWVNCDSLSSLRRLANRSPGRTVGLRINPGVGVGYGMHTRFRYAGARPTKLGIDRGSIDQALHLAQTSGLMIGGLHMHAGCGYLTSELDTWTQALDTCLSVADRCPQLRHVNIGGGLGVPFTAKDRPLDLERWSRTLEDRLAGRDLDLRLEPGDYIVRDAGVLLLQVNTVEVKQGVRFIGVNGGFNLHSEPAFYQRQLQCVPIRMTASTGAMTPATIAGNINEALDVWTDAAPFPDVQEGDYLAFLNAGGYGASLSSNHCMRGRYRECLVGTAEGTENLS